MATSEQMREIDRVSIEERGIDAFSLMQAAGRAVADDVAAHLPPGSIVVICGKGNNGGDGFVSAKALAENGWRVSVLFAESPERNAGAARKAWEELPESVSCTRLAHLGDLRAFLEQHDAAIDAILGTGTKGRPKAPWDRVIAELNAARLPVFAVDIPSGLDPDTGDADIAVIAWRTLAIGLAKIGMVSSRGPELCGTVRVEPIHFPKDLLDGVESQSTTLTVREAAALLPQRPRNGHKGTFGLLVIAAGSATMPGAAVLAGIGALRGGCGLVRMHVPDAVRNVVAANLPETLLANHPAGGDFLKPIGEVGWRQVLEKARALAVGPGMGRHPDSAAFLKEALTSATLPTVIDADALTIIAEDRQMQELLGERHVLTPHPGELASMMKTKTDDIQGRRWDWAREAAQRFRCTVLLKGSGTLVAEPDGSVTHIGAGNTAWARGGAGDVLTGLIGSLLAQGMPPPEAAKLGAFVHGMAADVHTRDESPRGALTREVAQKIPTAFRELENTQTLESNTT
ncbi:NAD(P)H-hydrate dehydratase [Candidatus Sumerlaeota bacterium]|nr:NAD(P)H-hydrate dehydratase [Candidatus Sumerlaeota bacterium]